MISKSTLLTFLLLIFAVLAVPSSRLGARMARRHGHGQSQHSNLVEIHADDASNKEYAPNWAGAILKGSTGTFTSATGTFTITTPTGSDGAVSAWVGIDGETCDPVFQTGVDFTLKNGKISYNAWYEWYPDESYDFSGIPIHAGDQISATVIAYSTTSGVAIIENLTTGTTVSKSLGSKHALCKESAEWIVEDFDDENGAVPLVNFGTVTFTNSRASDSSGSTHVPSGATIAIIRQNGKVLTSVTTEGDTVTVKYI